MMEWMNIIMNGLVETLVWWSILMGMMKMRPGFGERKQTKMRGGRIL